MITLVTRGYVCDALAHAPDGCHLLAAEVMPECPDSSFLIYVRICCRSPSCLESTKFQPGSQRNFAAQEKLPAQLLGIDRGAISGRLQSQCAALPAHLHGDGDGALAGPQRCAGLPDYL